MDIYLFINITEYSWYNVFFSILRCLLDKKCAAIQYKNFQSEDNCVIVNKDTMTFQTFVSGDKAEIYEKGLIPFFRFFPITQTDNCPPKGTHVPKSNVNGGNTLPFRFILRTNQGDYLRANKM